MCRVSEGFSSFPLYKMHVYFDSYPRIDLGALISFVNSTDPDFLPIQITPKKTRGGTNSPGPEMFTGALNGNRILCLSLHDMPSLDYKAIARSRLSREQKERLSGHRAMAMVACAGLEDECCRPYENMLMLYKIAMGLCAQGAIGAGSTITNLFFDREHLLGLLRQPWYSLEGEPLTLWQSLRQSHEPSEPLIYFTRFNLGDSDWLGTRGYSHCGFPDLFYRLGDERDKDNVREIFTMLFHHFMDHGPVIKPGDAMDYKWPIRFQRLPNDIDPPYQAPDMLMVTFG